MSSSTNPGLWKTDSYRKCLLRNRIPHPKYETLISKLLNGERLPQEAGVLELLYVSQSCLIFAINPPSA